MNRSSPELNVHQCGTSNLWKDILRAALSGLILLFLSSPAYAFGTIQLLGQNAEHEKITRIALSCRQDNRPNCFEGQTLDSLAGTDGTFGAVGAPDPGPTLFRFFAHCSGGDFLQATHYPRSKERARWALTMCRRFMQLHLKMAIKSAGELLNDKGEIRPAQTASIFPCGFGEGLEVRAKCTALKHFGAMLHAAQDFYAHSNWVDLPDQTKPLEQDNPPGLGNRGRAPWLDLRVGEPEFPEGLVSGCGGIDAVTDGEGGCTTKTGRLRIHHNMLNKDNGNIVLGVTPVIGEGSTPRGRINGNFRHAVEAAIEDTADKWLLFQERLVEAYGERQGGMLICVLVNDKPLDICAP